MTPKVIVVSLMRYTTHVYHQGDTNFIKPFQQYRIALEQENY